MAKCSKCNGKGHVSSKFATSIGLTCHQCGGSGEKESSVCDKHSTELTYCGITGWFCKHCDNYHWRQHQNRMCGGIPSY